MRDQGRDRCEGCALRKTRRDFLRDAAIGAALMLGLGARRSQASVIPRLLTGTMGGDGMLTYPVPDSESVSIDRREQIIVVRTDGKLYAFYLSCPHQHTALHWIEKHNQFECPKHHSKYRPDGEFIEGRATRSMDRYAVDVEGSQLIVDTTRLFRQDEDPDGWAAAFAVVPSPSQAGADQAAGASGSPPF